MFAAQKELGKFISLCVAFLVCVLSAPTLVSAAVLSLNPESGSYAVGSTVSLDVIIDTEGETINAVSGTMSYDTSAVRPTSIRISDSLVDLWIEEPSLSTDDGTITFEGLMLNPGFTGKGKVATINFEVISPTSSLISFTSGSALANDGFGTNLLSRFSGASLATYGAEGETIATKNRVVELPLDPSTLVLDSLRPPVVTSYTLRPERLNKFSLQGVTYPEAAVTMWLQKEEEPPEVLALRADKAGNFSYQHDSPYRNLQPLLPASVFSAATHLLTGAHYRFWLTANVSGSETPATQAFDMLVGGISMTEILIALLILIVLLLGGILTFQLTSLKEKVAVRMQKRKQRARAARHAA